MHPLRDLVATILAVASNRCQRRSSWLSTETIAVCSEDLLSHTHEPPHDVALTHSQSMSSKTFAPRPLPDKLARLKDVHPEVRDVKTDCSLYPDSSHGHGHGHGHAQTVTFPLILFYIRAITRLCAPCSQITFLNALAPVPMCCWSPV
jgi:hypothetical protein